ncbi:FHA domain-containing protein [Xanthomonadaceae bacterium JHOS43]|nr:FHA domain-containing protein [Xanthomonadaceae bacterium JHOS43]
MHLPDAGWLPHHASITLDLQRGLWLRLEQDAGVAHVNARPVRESAMLRLGDIVSLGGVQFCVMLQDESEIVRQLPPQHDAPMGDSERVAASRAVLRGVAGMFHGRTFPLAPGVMIGSAAEADIRIEGAGIASQHARVELHHERVILRAQARDNTLKVNGVSVADAVLHPGDQIVVEQHRFVVEAPGLPPRGGRGQGQRQRPITQAIPAVPASSPVAHQQEPQAASHGHFKMWWLLAAASAIALALAGILIYAPH